MSRHTSAFLLSLNLFLFNQAIPVAILPFALFGERFSLGARWVLSFSRCCYLIILCAVSFPASPANWQLRARRAVFGCVLTGTPGGRHLLRGRPNPRGGLRIRFVYTEQDVSRRCHLFRLSRPTQRETSAEQLGSNLPAVPFTSEI